MGPAGKEELKTGDEERSKREGKSERRMDLKEASRSKN